MNSLIFLKTFKFFQIFFTFLKFRRNNFEGYDRESVVLVTR